jgi:hypothetical protein
MTASAPAQIIAIGGGRFSMASPVLVPEPLAGATLTS